MIEEVIADHDIKKVGIIATKTTVASGVYQEKFARRKPELVFSALATPLLASMIEEGFYNNTISEAILNEYLSNPTLDHIDGLVLACTHYPLIKKEIDTFFKGKVKIFDSAEVVARKLKGILEKESLLSDSPLSASEFFVSDYTRAFEAATKIFFKKEIQLELCRL
jgi:glutamate racemase